MKHPNFLLFFDALINFFLGIVLLAYSKPVIKFFGLPETDNYFYPNILGGVLFGIGLALLLESGKKSKSAGLGFGGAISINLSGGIILLIWLIFGSLEIPTHGLIILWILAFILIIISLFELIVFTKNKKKQK